MPARARLAASMCALTLAAVATAACDDDGRRATLIATGTSAPSPSVSALVIPSTLPFQIMPVAGCPLSPPFASTFSIVVDGSGVDLFLYQAAFEFFDSRGFVSPLLFTQPELLGLFGTTFVAGSAQRTFAFTPQFGCGFAARPQSMTARLTFSDRQGVHFNRTIKGLF